MKYYYLKSSLPELGRPGLPAESQLGEIRTHIESNLDEVDRGHFRYLLYRNDNKNLLRLMRASEGVPETSFLAYNEPCAFAHQDLESGFAGITPLPAYMQRFVAEYRAGTLSAPIGVRGSVLSAAYYEEAMSLPSPFIRDYFAYKRDLKNILSAINARRFGLPLDQSLIGEYDLTVTLRTSRASDFGLSRSHPYIGELLRLIEEPNLRGLEKEVDRILWDFLEERTAYDAFGAPAIFAYFIRLSLGNRWVSLTREAGTAELRRILNRLLVRSVWPKEFAADERFASSEERVS